MSREKKKVDTWPDAETQLSIYLGVALNIKGRRVREYKLHAIMSIGVNQGHDDDASIAPYLEKMAHRI